MSEQTTLTIDARQAALHYQALGLAIEAAQKSLRLKNAGRFAQAVMLQINALNAERERLAEVFPVLVP